MTKQKENLLKAALEDVQKEAAGSKKSTEQKNSVERNETVMIGGHFPKSYKKQLRLIAAEEDTTSQALLEEALDLLFVKKGKAKILPTVD